MNTQALRDFAPFPKACIERGISKTVAYELLNAGKLDTKKIGRKRYIYLDSLLTVLERVDQENNRSKRAQKQSRAAA